MARRVTRRQAVQHLGAAGAAAALGDLGFRSRRAEVMVAGQRAEITVRSVSNITVRVTIRPLEGDRAIPVPVTGALTIEDLGVQRVRSRSPQQLQRARAGDLLVRYTENPPTIHVESLRGEPIQRLALDAVNPGMSFTLGNGPLLGLGEGGPQFDRRGTSDRMRSGQAGFRLQTHGTRVPVQWIVGTSGWAMFVHQPYGAFDFTGTEGKFTPSGAAGLPLDVFVTSSRDPRVIMREYARITGLPEMPARWTLGYLQSHRTLAGPEDILQVATKFREKRLPCDALIYLGTDFAPSGWNTHNGEFTWHPTNFPDPKGMLDTLHREHYKVIVHVVLDGRTLVGNVSDPCTAVPLPPGRTPDNRWPPDRQVSCYWPAHKQLLDVGVDGWWPDEGDGLDGPSRFNRHRMYWEGTQLYQPNRRVFALHRNASAGIQRYGGYIWSGDVDSRWETLKTHVPVAINTGLSGFPLWGTDIGGFIPTAEYTGELHVRWFQFGAFNPLFRSHGRNWHLRLPWGWDGGDGGPPETGRFTMDPAELRNKEVEPICKKYLELRYQLLPYLYTALRQSHETGLPIMRALWLHYPDDPTAVACGDQYMWGPDMLIAPVVEKGATSRSVYLPRGSWYDFWTDQRVEGGRTIERAVDLATMPIYVKAGAILPRGPIKQYTDEPIDAPDILQIYPGIDGNASLYQDDGVSFDYRRGAWMGLAMEWREAGRQLSLRLAQGSRWLPSAQNRFTIRAIGSATNASVTFQGRPVTVKI